MSYKELLEDIKKNKLKNIYLCFGKENYLKSWMVSTIKDKYIEKSFESLNFISLDGKETTIKDLINACETLPFMADKKLVVVENSYALLNNNDDKKFEDELLKYYENPCEFTILIFLVNENKIDNRKKLIKKIKDNGMIVEFNKLSGEDLNKWISKKFKEYNKKLDTKDIYFMVQESGYLENNSTNTLFDIENEIIKITNYVGSRDVINREDIEKVMIKSLQNNIFKLVDGIGQKRKEISLTLLNEMLLENEPIQVIVFMIIRQFRLLLMAKLLEEKGYSQGNITKKLGVHSFIANKVITQSRNFDTVELQNILSRCLEVDKILKTSSMDNKLAVEMLLIGL